jgi:SAM-dependent methyltransferase
MALLPELTSRRLEPEVMDDPGLDPASHRQALAGLSTVNWFSNSAGILWSKIGQLARSTSTLSLLDVASGGGDVAVGLWRRAARAGVRLQVLGLERSPLAIAVARERAKETAGQVEFAQADVLADPFPAGFQVITCSLFLHHLDETCAVALLRKMADAASDLLLVNDLHRSRGGYLLAQAACRLLSRSAVVHLDGPASIAAGFSMQEAAAFCQKAGITGASVERRWPSRLLLAWSPNTPR